MSTQTGPGPEDTTAKVPPFAVSVPDLALTPDPLDPGQIVSGTPEVSSTVLWTAPDGGWEHGVWQITPGIVTDTEADELFTVVSGRATITFQDGRVIEAGPGDACVLAAGDRTTWTVHETLRKVYSVRL
ncbi:cupin domain-containing protein [Streptomyces sp. SL13]|uniref:Cupin domain-containing protein n=1 Tax=Streptantibioticus silvisoli TaxID=2705255 RepID=A0AA90H5K2_9ACTN|nr:cupin domain-containing protein [Streptantibioticus silvisoli]MDI5973944.1 cupin domain-containing protein [Streptantibioticus silvisoli]